jgi:hypothetical protein
MNPRRFDALPIFWFPFVRIRGYSAADLSEKHPRCACHSADLSFEAEMRKPEQEESSPPKSDQNARIITAQALIANISATTIAFNAGSSSFIKAISTEITIVAHITVAGAMTHGILSAMSKRCSIL